MDTFNFQRKVLVDGVNLGWVSRTGGSLAPVEWTAWWSVPGQVKGRYVSHDTSKLRYAVQDIIHTAYHEARKLVLGH